MLSFVSLNIPFFYIQYFALENSIAADQLAFYLLSVITTGSGFGRVLPNFFANRIGPFNIICSSTIFCGGLVFASVNLSSSAGDGGDCIALWFLFRCLCLITANLLCAALT
jgi:hypothetical protein